MHAPFSCAVRRLLTVLLAVVVTVGTAIALPAPSGAALRHHRTPYLTFRATTVRTHHGVVRVRLLRVDLTGGHVWLRAVAAHDTIGGRHETVAWMARRTRAIAGINGDFWPWTDNLEMAAPVHGVITGSVMKTPAPETTSNLYVTTDGRAHIGAKPYALGYAWRDGRVLRHGHVLRVNNVTSAFRGHNVWLTPSWAGGAIPRCTVAQLRRSGTGWRVARVTTRLTRLARLRSYERAVLDCGVPFRPVVGNVLFFSATPAGEPVRTLISGGVELVRHGVRFHDPHAQLINRVPQGETFACVSGSGTNVLLGIAERFVTRIPHSRVPLSPGMTTAELQNYLTRTLHCWSAMGFDGGGSTTMVYRGVVQNRPTYGAQRPVADGLFVYGRP